MDDHVTALEPEDVVTAVAPATPALDPNRWKALGVIAIAQLMVVLDASIVNLALPSAKHALHISDATSSGWSRRTR
jgi:hypothetical protein